MNRHSLVGLLQRFTPATTAQWAIAACVLGLVAALYVRSLAWVYSKSRERMRCPGAALAAVALAAMSWPCSLLLMRVIHPCKSAPRPRRKPGRRFWLRAGPVACAVVVCAILGPEAALGVAFLAALAVTAAIAAAIATSIAVVVVIVYNTDTILGVVLWAIVVLGMLAFVIWNERRVMTPPRREIPTSSGG